MSANRIRELEEAIDHHDHRYWDLRSPEISDTNYDLLKRELQNLDPQNDRLIGSPRGDVPKGEVYEHRIPMLSLNKAYTQKELRNWLKVVKEKGCKTLIGSPKMDGSAISLHYQNGRLVRAVTRGNAIKGEVVTKQVVATGAIPNRGKSGEVRGELYLPHSELDRCNRKRIAAGEEPYKNCRAAASGALGNDDLDWVADMGLQFCAYNLLVDGQTLTFNQRLTELVERGFQTLEAATLSPDLEHMQWFIKSWETKRPTLEYDIDGVVFRVDEHSIEKELGETGHHPRYAIAFKWEEEKDVTTIRRIEGDVSRFGVITPVAIVDPVSLSGAVVSRATLNNFDWMMSMGASIGSQVRITRRGGIIPCIEEVVESGGDDYGDGLARCPACQTPSIIRAEAEGVQKIYCPNHHCPGRLAARIEHFTKCLDIEGFGPTIIAQLVERKWVTGPLSIYKLTEAQLANLNRSGPGLAKRLYSQIQEKREVDLWELIQALGIPQVGRTYSRAIQERYGTLENFWDACMYDTLDVPGIGAADTRTICDWLQGDNCEVPEEILTVVRIRPPVERTPVPSGHPMAGHTFLFTGEISLPRFEAERQVRIHGGEVLPGVSKRLEYLVVGQNPGRTKMEKARDYQSKGIGIQLLDEQQFMDLVRSPLPVRE